MENYIGVFEINGEVYHVIKNGDKLQAGYATNTGIIPLVELESDDCYGLDQNLAELYALSVEFENSSEV
jgi:hypothetical protein